MKEKSNISILRSVPIIFCFVIILYYLFGSEDITVQTILDYVPDNLYAAALVFLLMYALKSVSIVFPILILEVAVGHLFSVIPAIIINMGGVIVGFVIAYFMGYFSGEKAITKLTKKYPAIEKIMKKQNEASFFTCFFLRTLCFLPGDAVSVYLGSVRMPFKIYLLASILGSLHSIILATLFGSQITEPASPMFWVSFVLMVLISVGSFGVYYFYRQRIEPSREKG